jgi:hypothetical protein
LPWSAKDREAEAETEDKDRNTKEKGATTTKSNVGFLAGGLDADCAGGRVDPLDAMLHDEATTNNGPEFPFGQPRP